MITVLVVDDSAVAREFLVHLIDAAPGMRVVGTAADGEQAVEAAQRLRPSIITMDIIMPRLSGPEAIERIMQRSPAPIVVVTGNTITAEVRATFESLDSGALAIVPRPYGAGCKDHVATSEHLLRTLRLMAEVKVVRRIPRRMVRKQPAGGGAGEAAPHGFRVVAMGASTGGPSALKTILGELPAGFPVPILVAQHIAPGFVEGFASWLGDTCRLPVGLASAGEKLARGRVYVAPDGAHLGVDKEERIVLAIAKDRPLTAVCPSVDRLFESVVAAYGSQAIGVLLTGMGRDGADGMLKLRRAGAITMAQDRESSVVYGMPAEAVALGAVNYVLPPLRMAEMLVTFASAAVSPKA